MVGPVAGVVRSRGDRCPGVLRPWPADDGALVRLRLPAGRMTPAQLVVLADLAERHGDGDLHLTSRANVQLRGLAAPDGHPPDALVDALTAAGLLPSPAHDLVRNLACSPFTGLVGGLVDLRPVLRALDRALLADPRLVALPGKFLLTLDDGRHDVAGGGDDLTAVAVDARTARVVVGGLEAGVVPLPEVVPALLRLAHAFLEARGDGADAAWHVAELPAGGRELVGDRPAWTPPRPAAAPPYGRLTQDDGAVALHLAVAGGRLAAVDARRVAGAAGEQVVLTPDRGLLLPAVPGATTTATTPAELR